MYGGQEAQSSLSHTIMRSPVLRWPLPVEEGRQIDRWKRWVGIPWLNSQRPIATSKPIATHSSSSSRRKKNKERVQAQVQDLGTPLSPWLLSSRRSHHVIFEFLFGARDSYLCTQSCLIRRISRSSPQSFVFFYNLTLFVYSQCVLNLSINLS